MKTIQAIALKFNHWLLALGVFLLTLGFMVYKISNPYPWSDEGASVLAISRSWENMFILGNSSDIPLLPYYIIGKTFASVFFLIPPLLALRLLSAVAAATAAACIWEIARRYEGKTAAIYSVAVLLLIPGFTRYGQEARPYALLVCFSALSWLLFKIFKDRQPDRFSLKDTGYIFSLSILGIIHTFGLFQWVAQGISILFEKRKKLNIRIIPIFIGAIIISAYPIYLIARGGTGPRSNSTTSLMQILKNLIRSISPTSNSTLISITILAAVLIAILANLIFRKFFRRRILTDATIWLFTLTILMSFLSVFKPNLLRPRYWQPIVLPISLLIGVGAAIVLTHLFNRLREKSVSWTLILVLIISALGAYSAQPFLRAQSEIRSKTGHSVDLSKLIKLSEEFGGVIMQDRTKASSLEVEKPDSVLNMKFVQTDTLPWLVERKASEINLSGRNSVVVIANSEVKARPLPKYLNEQGFIHVVSSEQSGKWTIKIVSK